MLKLCLSFVFAFFATGFAFAEELPEKTAREVDDLVKLAIGPKKTMDDSIKAASLAMAPLSERRHALSTLIKALGAGTIDGQPVEEKTVFEVVQKLLRKQPKIGAEKVAEIRQLTKGLTGPRKAWAAAVEVLLVQEKGDIRQALSLLGRGNLEIRKAVGEAVFGTASAAKKVALIEAFAALPAPQRKEYFPFFSPEDRTILDDPQPNLATIRNLALHPKATFEQMTFIGSCLSGARSSEERAALGDVVSAQLDRLFPASSSAKLSRQKAEESFDTMSSLLLAASASRLQRADLLERLTRLGDSLGPGYFGLFHELLGPIVGPTSLPLLEKRMKEEGLADYDYCRLLNGVAGAGAQDSKWLAAVEKCRELERKDKEGQTTFNDHLKRLALAVGKSADEKVAELIASAADDVITSQTTKTLRGAGPLPKTGKALVARLLQKRVDSYSLATALPALLGSESIEELIPLLLSKELADSTREELRNETAEIEGAERKLLPVLLTPTHYGTAAYTDMADLAELKRAKLPENELTKWDDWVASFALPPEKKTSPEAVCAALCALFKNAEKAANPEHYLPVRGAFSPPAREMYSDEFQLATRSLQGLFFAKAAPFCQQADASLALAEINRIDAIRGPLFKKEKAELGDNILKLWWGRLLAGSRENRVYQGVMEARLKELRNLVPKKDLDAAEAFLKTVGTADQIPDRPTGATVYAKSFLLLWQDEVARATKLDEASTSLLAAQREAVQKSLVFDLMNVKHNQLGPAGSGINTFSYAVSLLAIDEPSAALMEPLRKIASRSKNPMALPYLVDTRAIERLLGSAPGAESSRGSAARNVPAYLALATRGDRALRAGYDDKLLDAIENFLVHTPALLYHVPREDSHLGRDSLAPYYFYPAAPYVSEAMAHLSRASHLSAEDKARLERAKKKWLPLLCRWINAKGEVPSLGSGTHPNSPNFAVPLMGLALLRFASDCGGVKAAADRPMLYVEARPGQEAGKERKRETDREEKTHSPGK